MAGLSERDIAVLKYYAVEQKNRELYWNYLAQVPGNDGYGLLALGVVRNDNVPGQVANAYAKRYAKEHSGVTLSERQWEAFGVDLMQEDFALRAKQFHEERRPDRALNLSVENVQNAHDKTFQDWHIDPDAWTPRKLLNASRRHGNEAEAEKIWTGMLDNAKFGIERGVDTTYNVVWKYNDAKLEAGGYLGDMAKARADAALARPNTNPDRIGTIQIYYEYDRPERSWNFVSDVGGDGPHYFPVKSPAEIQDLNDTRQLRFERQEKRQHFHPQDHYRVIAESPATLAEVDRRREERPVHVAATSMQAVSGIEVSMRPSPHADASEPLSYLNSAHPNHCLYQELREKLPAGVSDEKVAELTLAARQGGVRPNRVESVHVLDNGDAWVLGTIPGFDGMVNLRTPAPPMAETMQKAEAFEQQQQVQVEQWQEQRQSQSQGREMA